MENKIYLYNPTRRKFIKDVSLATVSLFALSMMTGGCESCSKKIANRPMRRLIRDNELANAAVQIYRDGVAAMKALPSSDARNWTKQAEIHDDFCPHGNWFFFPWHRAYLFHFEKIIQNLTGEETFGLPYWNWCYDGHIPSGFWEPPSGNSLYDSTRIATDSSVASSSSTGLSLVSGYCDETDFNLFAGGETSGLRTGGGSYGNVEGTPHNYIHGTFVRGNMATFMSPLDPIFWCHHCMVDVCWFEWNIKRSHPNTSDTDWTNFNLSGMFCNGDGSPADPMAVIVTVLMPLLSYQYETGIDGSTAAADLVAGKSKSDMEKIESIIKKGTSLKLDVRKKFTLDKTFEFSIRKPVPEKITIDANEFARIFSSGKEDRVLLKIKNLTQPPKSDVYLRVFINKPDAGMQTPIEDPHYAGSFYFFVHGGDQHKDMHAENPDIYVDVTNTLKNLKRSGELENFENVEVSIIPVPVSENDQSDFFFTAKGMEVIISPVKIELMNLK